MKIKKAFSFIILLVTTIVLMGCQTSTKKKYNISEVEEIFKSLESNTNIDLDYKLNMDSSIVSMTINSKVIIKSTGEKQMAFITASNGTDTIEMYYIDQYVCQKENGTYTVTEDNEFLKTANPIPTDLDFSNLDYKLNKKISNGKIIYTVKIEDQGLKSFVDQIIDEDFSDMSIKMDLIVTVDKKTNELESMQFLIILSKDNTIINIDMTLTINALGDKVSIEVPALVTQKIDFYILDKIDPKPKPIVYEYTLDGIVDYYKLGYFRKILYDKKTDKLVVLRNSSIDIFNANTMSFESKISTETSPACVDVDGGKLVVGYMSNQFEVYDLAKNLGPTSFQTNIKVFEIAIDGNVVIYADDNQWCDVVFHNILTNEKKVISSVFEPLLTINRKDHILYLTETGLTSTNLMYFNSQDGSLLYLSQFSQFVNASNRILFDGKYIHHEGKTFNRFTGSVVSSNYLNRLYPSFDGFLPESNLYDSDSISFVSSIESQNKVAIYKNVENNFVYSFSLAKGSIIEMKDGKYLAVCGKNENVAVVDVKLIDEDLINDKFDDDKVETITVSLDGKFKTLESSIYDKSLVDGNYIYTISESNYELNVYDVITLKKVYSEKFLIKPVSIDADSSKLVIGFGDAMQFRVYSTETWNYETVITNVPIFSSVLYKDRVIYAEVDQHCSIFDYNLKSKSQSDLGHIGYYVSMAINREKGIVYFGDRNSSSSYLTYFNLESNNIISRFEVYGGSTIVRFDGNFVHYENATFNETSAIKISNNSKAREYKNINNMTNLNTIFDDESISVFSAMENGEIIIIVYDLVTNTHLYTCKGKGTNAYRNGNTIIVLDNIGETIRTININ